MHQGSLLMNIYELNYIFFKIYSTGSVAKFSERRYRYNALISLYAKSQVKSKEYWPLVDKKILMRYITLYLWKGFLITSGQIFWYVTLEAIWYMYNIRCVYHHKTMCLVHLCSQYDDDLQPQRQIYRLRSRTTSLLFFDITIYLPYFAHEWITMGRVIYIHDLCMMYDLGLWHQYQNYIFIMNSCLGKIVFVFWLKYTKFGICVYHYETICCVKCSSRLAKKLIKRRYFFKNRLYRLEASAVKIKDIHFLI